MRQAKQQLLLVEDPLELLYLTGQQVSSGSFIAYDCKEPDFVVDARYYHGLKVGYWRPHLLEKGFWEKLLPPLAGKTLLFDPDKTSYSRYREWCERAAGHAIALAPQSALMAQLQRVKDDEQLKGMARAGQLACAALREAMNALQVGITEKQIERVIRSYCFDHGAQVSFDPIVAFGASSAIPHHHSGQTRLEQNQIVLIDLGAQLDDCCSDMTRTFFYAGPADARLERIWHLTYEAFELAKRHLKAGVDCAFLDKLVREHFRHHGLEEYFMHSLGHGIGLRVHEAPRLRSDSVDGRLETATTITIEPGLYLPSIGGVRLEDSFALTEDGFVCLTPYQMQIGFFP